MAKVDWIKEHNKKSLLHHLIIEAMTLRDEKLKIWGDFDSSSLNVLMTINGIDTVN